jgi:hypothetical protein
MRLFKLVILIWIKVSNCNAFHSECIVSTESRHCKNFLVIRKTSVTDPQVLDNVLTNGILYFE